MNSKRKGQIKHALKRANERFGIKLTDHDLTEIRMQIESGRAKPICKQSNRVTIHIVKLPNGDLAKVAYDKKRKTVTTFLYDWMGIA